MIRNSDEIETRIRSRIETLKRSPQHSRPKWIQNEKDVALKELYTLLVWMYEEE